ncbi:MAG TPA: rhodanese-like domain-containing protein [Gammaproteobacteria bacterium]|nr:rhodanese-like domain-containing protein [Gammaproteobacteria bacterium]
MEQNEYVKFAIEHWELCLAFFMVLLYWITAELTDAFSKHGISAQHLVTLMNHHDAVVFDIRDAEHFNKGHILGALSHPEKDILSDLSKLKKYQERKVVLVDVNGQSSNKLINKLLTDGFKEVFFLKNGMHAWTAEKLPVSKS